MSKGDSPLKQFEIKPLIDLELFGIDISFTNSSLWMVITTILILAFFSLPFLRSNKTNSIDDLYPSRIQVAAELGFNFITNLIEDTVGKEGKKFFPLVFSLFMFILFGFRHSTLNDAPQKNRINQTAAYISSHFFNKKRRLIQPTSSSVSSWLAYRKKTKQKMKLQYRC